MIGRAVLLPALFPLLLSASAAPLAPALKSTASPDAMQACHPARFEGSLFTHCIATPGQDQVSLRITGRDGVIYRGFARLARDVPARDVLFAMNGGMYDAQSRPIGYYVGKGQKLHALNTADGSGNFHMKPNGVFFGDAVGWHVLPTDAFARYVTQRPEFGTQSGPMLVINGAIHPAISPQGTSLYRRNAVGVDSVGKAHFVISDEPVSFGRMARFMRDAARTPNALYLDGEVSALWHPAGGRLDQRYPLGPLIVVTRAKAS